ncbi:MAG TPA: transporter, partial [Chitinophagaceae bacterium]|nr:transporter [Chitinophagaceae bacterium]
MNTDIKTFKATDLNTDFEVRSQNAICVNNSALDKPLWSNLKFTFAGILFGIILIKSEVISWFRIQEMFRLQSFHMFGVIGSAIVVGIISVFIIKKFKVRSIDGEP